MKSRFSAYRLWPSDSDAGVMSMRMLAQYLVAVTAAMATIYVVPPAVADDGDTLRHPGVVRVESGWLRGSVAADHVAYSAIPYAAPPVGSRRWRPPTDPKRWHGVRKATTPSPLCPQSGTSEGEVVGQENCLFLDVTVPRGAERGDRLPVLVWLHGGGLDSGGAQRFSGSTLAVQGNLVVVTINYRLGALGFLSTPELGRDAGNYGLMDQVAALRWVHRNIARFGGDKHEVTLAGQSGGARAICAQLASPRARGLFDRAIIQSGACSNDVPTRSEGHAFGEQAIAKLGCTTSADVAACLRRRSPGKLVGTLQGVGHDLTGRVKDRPWNPVARTRTLPVQPGVALRTGFAARVPLLVGATRDEMRGHVFGRVPSLTAQDYHTMVTETFGDDAAAVLEHYPAAAYERPALALAAVLTDWGGQIGTCPVLRDAQAAARHQPVYSYEFAEGGGEAPGGFPLGSYHGLELPYLWTLNGYSPYPPLTPAQEQLSATMIDYWAAFAHTGNPNGPDRPRWPAFGPDGTVLGLSTGGIAPTPFAENHHCELWAGVER